MPGGRDFHGMLCGTRYYLTTVHQKGGYNDSTHSDRTHASFRHVIYAGNPVLRFIVSCTRMLCWVLGHFNSRIKDKVMSTVAFVAASDAAVMKTSPRCTESLIMQVASAVQAIK